MTDTSQEVVVGDCVHVMRDYPDGHFHAVVCDPPYGLEFMGKEWDRLDGAFSNLGLGSGAAVPSFGGDEFSGYNPTCDTCGGRARGAKRCECAAPAWRVKGEKPIRENAGELMQSWHLRWAAEAFRVLAPGGHLLAFGGSRTSHRLASALEDAGFEIRDTLMWLYGSGFPKSRNVADDAGADWNGWGTALKPAHEPVVVARKPFRGTVAENVLEHGAGALNIDACRVDVTGGRPLIVGHGQDSPGKNTYGANGPGGGSHADGTTLLGRWPPNVVLSHDEGCQLVGRREIRGDGNWSGSTDSVGYEGGWDTSDHPRDRRVPAVEVVEVWECTPGCPVAELDRQAPNAGGGGFPGEGGGIGQGLVYGTPGSGEGLRDTGRVDENGGASRFFYCAKVSRLERDAGLGDFPEVVPPAAIRPKVRECRVCGSRTKPSGDKPGAWPACGHDDWQWVPNLLDRLMRNVHPTVKPIDLMRWLIRLVTPPGGRILDPFAGSGSTLCAAAIENVEAVGIEQSAEYAAIARDRVAFWRDHGPEALETARVQAVSERVRAEAAAAGQLDIFDSA